MQRKQTIPIPASDLGSEHAVTFFHHGSVSLGPKVYLQAGLHANEIPGMLVLHLLNERLQKIPDQIIGHIVIAPIANPIGLGQHTLGAAPGRFDLRSGVNFNRQFPDVTATVLDSLDTVIRKNTDDPALIHKLVADGIQSALAALTPKTPHEHLKKILLTQACGADAVFDLHCDTESLLHLYVNKSQWPDLQTLAARLNVEVVLCEDNIGGNTFQESALRPWEELKKRFPTLQIQPKKSATIELRGKRDVTCAQAQQDADRLFAYLQEMGAVVGDPGPAPAFKGLKTELAAVDVLHAPKAGILILMKKLGDRVHVGECVAQLIDPTLGETGESAISVQAQTEGILFTHSHVRYCSMGEVIGKIAGTEILAYRKTGNILVD